MPVAQSPLPSPSTPKAMSSRAIAPAPASPALMSDRRMGISMDGMHRSLPAQAGFPTGPGFRAFRDWPGLKFFFPPSSQNCLLTDETNVLLLKYEPSFLPPPFAIH